MSTHTATGRRMTHEGPRQKTTQIIITDFNDSMLAAPAILHAIVCCKGSNTLSAIAFVPTANRPSSPASASMDCCSVCTHTRHTSEASITSAGDSRRWRWGVDRPPGPAIPITIAVAIACARERRCSACCCGFSSCCCGLLLCFSRWWWWCGRRLRREGAGGTGVGRCRGLNKLGCCRISLLT